MDGSKFVVNGNWKVGENSHKSLPSKWRGHTTFYFKDPSSSRSWRSLRRPSGQQDFVGLTIGTSHHIHSTGPISITNPIDLSPSQCRDVGGTQRATGIGLEVRATKGGDVPAADGVENAMGVRDVDVEIQLKGKRESTSAWADMMDCDSGWNESS